MSLLPKPTAAAEAIVLRTWACGETSVIASLLTRDRGYVRVMAKGARGARSLLRPLVEPGRLVQIEFSWDPDRELQYLRSGSVTLDCHVAGATLEDTAYLLAALELADRCRPVSMSDQAGGQDAGDIRTAGEVFAICEEFLRVLSSPSCSDPALLFFAFEWELLQRHGIEPEVTGCASCGRPADAEHAVLWFRPSDGGVVCGDCFRDGASGGGKPLQAEALEWLRRLQDEGLGAVAAGPLTGTVRRQLGAHLHRFLGYHMPGYRLPSALELLRAGKESTR